MEKYYITRVKECFKQKVRQVASSSTVHKRRVQAIVIGRYCLVTQGFTRPNTVLYYKEKILKTINLHIHSDNIVKLQGGKLKLKWISLTSATLELESFRECLENML